MADIVLVDNPTDREVKWVLYYYEEWEVLPNKNMQSAFDKFRTQPNMTTMGNMLIEEDVLRKLEKTIGKTGAKKAITSGLNRLVAREIVQASVGGIASQTGRRGAIVVAEESARLAAARGANVAFTGIKAIGSLPVGITAAIGEAVGDAISSKAGIKNHHAKNAIGVGGSIAGGATAGAVVAGPIGAAAGAAVGVGSWAFGQGFKTILRKTDARSTDNRCYIEVGNIGAHKICVGTYAGDDTLYWKTYKNEYKESNSKFSMSAGQPSTRRFQLCIWHEDRVIHHFNDVYYRDLFGVVKIGRKFRVLHCRGEYHPVDAGKTFIFEN